MSDVDLRKIYKFHAIEPAPSPDALPSGGDLYYECADCNDIVPSVIRIRVSCVCGNLCGQSGKLEIKDAAKVKVMRGVLK
ncbi:MAG: hypothetical protein FWH15_07435 [Betaproteobacteria bacterium]|nr:hypothetical protein [Betaproteobacteria bacterium]